MIKQNDKVSINRGSKGSKIENIVSTSFPPGITCTSAPCYAEGCYAYNIYKRRKNVRDAWDRNFRIYRKDPDSYWKQLEEKIVILKTTLFRYMVGGDIPNQEYLDSAYALAKKLPETKFLIFTKRYSLEVSTPPKNLTVVISTWPGYPAPSKYIGKLPFAWVDNGSENRILPTFMKCAHFSVLIKLNCFQCRTCWNLTPQDNIVFPKHR